MKRRLLRVWIDRHIGWHLTYCRWYDADRIGHRLPTIPTAGVNDRQGTSLLPDGTDDVPDKSKGAADSTLASHPAPAVTHECVFVEEQEPSGRLILPPCIVCGFTAMEALEQLHTWLGAAGEPS